MEQIIFYILSGTILLFSILTVTSRQILRAAIYLLFTLIGTAGLYFLFNYNFLAAVQITVYIGGIVVLIIFSVLLTSNINEKLKSAGLTKSIFNAVATIAGAILCISVISGYTFIASKKPEIHTTIEVIGMKMLSYDRYGYVLPFEVISILLLAAMIGAIIIAKSSKPNSK